MKIALVTGVSSGIGSAIARRLLADGWGVLGLSRRRPEFSDENFQHRTADLGNSAALAAALAGMPRIAAFVHAAGILRLDRIGESDPGGTGAAMWQVHVNAAVALGDLVIPTMPDGGRIVLIGSRASRGAANRAQYAASKAALSGLARSWALELVSRRITVNLVSPAATDTPMQHDPARASTPPRLPPFGSLIDPDEVAALASFLLSANARNITGQEIFVCGGASL